MADYYFTLLSIGYFNFYQSHFCIQGVYDSFYRQQSQVDIHDIVESSLEANCITIVPLYQIDLLSGAVEPVVRESLQALRSVKLIILASLLHMYNRRYLSKGIILVIDLIKKICSIFVEDDQQSLIFQFVHLELVIPLQILQKVLVFKFEALSGLFEDEDDVGREEDHEIVIKDKEIAVFEAVGASQLFKSRDVRPFVFDWEAFESGEADAGWTEVYVLKVSVKFWLSFETFFEGDIDGLGLVEVGSYYLYFRILNLLNRVRSNHRQKENQSCYEKDACAHCRSVNIIKRQKLLFKKAKQRILAASVVGGDSLFCVNPAYK